MLVDRSGKDKKRAYEFRIVDREPTSRAPSYAIHPSRQQLRRNINSFSPSYNSPFPINAPRYGIGLSALRRGGGRKKKEETRKGGKRNTRCESGKIFVVSERIGRAGRVAGTRRRGKRCIFFFVRSLVVCGARERAKRNDPERLSASASLRVRVLEDTSRER